jgi:hypothetical protein
MLILIPSILFGQESLDENRIYPAPVGKKEGYIDYTGEFVIPPTYYQTGAFCPDNRAAIVSTKTLDGIIDLKGAFVVPMAYHSLRRINTMKDEYGYLYLASIDEKYGIINLANQVIIPLKYDYIDAETEYFIVGKDKMAGVLNLSNEVILPLEYDEIHQDAEYAGFVVKGTNDKWALYEEDGKQICEPIFDDRNIEFTSSYINGPSNGEYLTIDYYGMVHPNFDFDVFGFEANDYSVVKTKDRLYGLIDKDYNWILEPKYERLFYDNNVKNNQILLFKENYKWGIMDLEGTILLLPECKRILQVSQTVFGLSLDKTGYRLFDLPANKWITTEKYFHIDGDEAAGIIEVNENPDQYENNLWGLLNFQGEMVLEPDNYIYNYLEPGVFEIYGEEDNNSTGIYSLVEKKMLIPPIFDLVYYEPNHLVEVNYWINDDSRYKIAYLDRQGKLIWAEPNFKVQQLMDAFYKKNPRYAK